MRLRVVIVVAFAALIAMPLYLAYTTGILPGPAQAAAGSLDSSSGSATGAVTSLAWPDEPLGLTVAGTRVLWQQRDASASVAGLWAYDVRDGKVDRVLSRSATGKADGFPSACDGIVAWAAWRTRRGEGQKRVQAYDAVSTRLWTVAETGRNPTATVDTVIWVDPHASGSDDAIHGVNSLTDDEYSFLADGHVKELAAWGNWVAWIGGRGKTGAVWAGSYRKTTRYRLSSTGTAVTIDRHRVVWAQAVGRHSTAIVSWDRHSSRSTILYRVVGSASSLFLSDRYAVWVTTRDKSGAQVWAYDFAAARAFAVDPSTGTQASPVVAGGDVYWADDRGGDWELYRRSLPD